jgi:2-oxoisovalerate dehydrogenase E2 component (dihydrolipoyl transacylase)
MGGIMSVQTTGQVFLLPDLGEGLVEAELVTWLVAVGDTVHIDQPIAEVETAKSVVEVPSPFEGTVATLHGAEGDMLEVGKPLITIDVSAGSGNVLIGYGTSDAGGPGRSRPAVRVAAKTAPLVVSPLVRKLAQDHGIALADINGSGSDGLILRSDVEAAIGEPASGVVDQRTGLTVVSRTPLTGVKKAAAAALVRSRREIPDATVWVDVDATALLELRQGLKAKGTAPGVLAFLARFVAAGLVRFPELNMQLAAGDGQDELVEFGGINLGFATQTDRGLVVPVLRNAQGRSARELDEAIRELTERALGGKAAPAQLGGGTFTINNYGVLGVDGSAAIINHPEAAMLGLGRIMDKPWVVDGELCVRKMTELTLAFDHRVCDGAVAAGFLRFVADAMENPASILADL